MTNPNAITIIDDSFASFAPGATILTPTYSDSSGNSGSGKWSINSNGQLICKGGASPGTQPGHFLTLQLTNNNPVQSINQEVWVQFPAGGLDRLISGGGGSVSLFGIALRINPQDLNSSNIYQTFYKFSLDSSNIHDAHASQLGYDTGEYGFHSAGFTLGHSYAYHAYAYWDELHQYTALFQEIIDLTNVGSAVTPFGNGTQNFSYTDQSARALVAPGQPNHRSIGNAPGSLCPTTGSYMALFCNPNGDATGIKIQRIIWNDPVGIDVTTSAQGSTANPQRTFSFPGWAAGYLSGQNLTGTSPGPGAFRGTFIATEDMDSVVFGFTGFNGCQAGQGDSPLLNSYNVLASLEYPIQPLINLPLGQSVVDGLSSTAGTLTPAFKGNGSRLLTVTPNSVGYLTATPPQRIKVGDTVGWRLQVKVPQGGFLPECIPTGDAPAYITTPEQLPAPASLNVQAVFYNSNGSVANGTYYFVGTAINEGSGETTASGQVAINTNQTGPVTSSTYSTNTAGYPVMTDPGLALAVNAYVGTKFTVSGHDYNVVSNTATAVTLVQRTGAGGNGTVGWNGSQPANSTAYTLAANAFIFSVPYQEGAQQWKLYGGTTNGSNYFLQVDPLGVPYGQSQFLGTTPATSGSNPPGSNTAVKDYTIIKTAGGSQQQWTGAGLAVEYMSPHFIGGQVVKPPSIIVGALGTSITRGYQDYGTNRFSGTGGVANVDAAGGWFDRAFKTKPGVGNGIVAVNLALSGSPLINDLTDIHGRQFQARLAMLQSCTHVVIDHYTNDNAPLPVLQAFYLQLINLCRSMGLQVWVSLPIARPGIATPVDLFTTEANQTTNPDFGGLASGSRYAQFVAWIKTLAAAGTINGYFDMPGVVQDTTNGKWLAITPGTQYYDPVTYALSTWNLVSFTATGVDANTLTFSGGSWTTNQWSANGTYVVTMGGSSAIIGSNTSTVLTLTTNQAGTKWTNGTPSLGTATLQPIMTPDGVHPAPHGAAQMAVKAKNYIPAMTLPTPVFTVNDLPVSAQGVWMPGKTTGAGATSHTPNG